MSRFEIVRELGGGPGRGVTLARDRERGGSLVVLKGGEPAALAREYLVLATVRHPGLARAIGLVGAGDHARLVREYVAGMTLAEAASRRKLGRDELLDVAVALLGVVDRLHGEGFLHLDVKPDNVVLPDERDVGELVLLDAGASLSLAEARQGGRAGGTPGFAAPEVLAGVGVDARSDLFSIGRTLRTVAATTSGGDDVDAFLARLDDVDPRRRFRDAAEALAQPVVEARVRASVQRRPPPLPYVFTPRATKALERKLDDHHAIVLHGPAKSGLSTRLHLWNVRCVADGGDTIWLDGGRGPAILADLAAQVGAAEPDVDPVLPGDESSPAFRAARRLLAAAASGGLTIFVDDAHRLDRGVRDAIVAAARGGGECRMRVVFAARRELDDSLESIELPAVSREELAAAMRRAGSRAPDRRLLAEAADRLVGQRRSIDRIALAFRAALRRTGAAAAAIRTLAHDRIPAAPSIRRADHARLSPVERQVIDLLVRADEPMAERALRLALGDASGAGLAATQGLVRREWVHRTGDGRLFVEPRLAEIARRAQGPTERARLSKRLVCAYEGDDPTRVLLHRFLANPNAKVGKELADEVQRLREEGWTEPATWIASRASGEGGRFGALCFVEGARTRLGLGQVSTPERQLQRAARSDDPVVAARARLGLAEAAQARGALDEALERLDAASAAAVRLRDHRLVVRARSLECYLRYRLGEYARVLDRVDEVLPSVSDPIELALLSNLRGIACLRLADLDGAEEHLRRAHRLFEEASNHAGTAMVANNLALAAARRGEEVRALRMHLRLRRDGLRHDAPHRFALAANNAALIFRDAGRLDRATRLFDEAVRTRRALGDRYGLASSLSNRGTVQCEAGDATAGLRDFRESRTLFEGIGAADKVLILRKNVVRALLALGDLAATEREARSALFAARRRNAVREEADLLFFDGIRAVRSTKRGPGRVRLSQARERFERLGLRARVIDVDLELGLAATDQEEDRGALVGRLTTALDLEGDRERRAMIELVLAGLVTGRDRVRLAVAAFDRLQRSERPRWRLLAAVEAARAAAAEGRSLALARAVAVGCEARDRLARGAPGAIDPAAAATLGEFDDRALPTDALAGPSEPFSTAGGVGVRAVLDLYRRLAAATDVEPLLDVVLETALSLTGASRAFLLVRDRSEAVVVRSLRSDGRVATEPDAEWSRTILESVIESGRAVVIGDAALDPRWGGSLSVQRLRLRSVACVPMHAGGRTLGALYVDNVGRVAAFDPERLDLLERFADQASLALIRVETEGRVRELNRVLERRLQRAERLLLAARRSGRLTEALRPMGRLIGSSEAMTRVRCDVERAALTDLPVLLIGESGTGKSLAARAVHDASPRASGPFVVMGCASIPSPLFEAEVFGVERGSFTGARARRGLLQEADGGTLFLDDVGELGSELQAKLLRVLESGECRPVGGEMMQVDVRVVAAAAETIDERRRAGTFREDLFYRLRGLEVRMPPLRTRGDDVVELAERFLESASREGRGVVVRLGADARRALLDHAWPGNVRELENEMRRLATLVRGTIAEADLAPSIRIGSPDPAAALPVPALSPAVARDLKQRTEEDLVRRALAQTLGNRSRAAALLGMSRYGFLKKLRRLGLDAGR